MSTPVIRKQQILDAAMVEADKHGYRDITRAGVAERVGCSPALVSFYWGTMKQLHRSIMGEAVRVRHLRILAQGIIAKDARALGAPDDLRKEALRFVMGV